MSTVFENMQLIKSFPFSGDKKVLMINIFQFRSVFKKLTLSQPGGAHYLHPSTTCFRYLQLKFVLLFSLLDIPLKCVIFGGNENNNKKGLFLRDWGPSINDVADFWPFLTPPPSISTHIDFPIPPIPKKTSSILQYGCQ